MAVASAPPAAGGGGQIAHQGRAEGRVTADGLEQARDARGTVGAALTTTVEQDLREGIAGKQIGKGHLGVAEVGEGRATHLGGVVPVECAGGRVASGIEVAVGAEAQHADVEHRRHRQGELRRDRDGRRGGHLAGLKRGVVVAPRPVVLGETTEATGWITGTGHEAAHRAAEAGVGAQVRRAHVVEAEVAKQDGVAAVAVGRQAEDPRPLADPLGVGDTRDDEVVAFVVLEVAELIGVDPAVVAGHPGDEVADADVEPPVADAGQVGGIDRLAEGVLLGGIGDPGHTGGLAAVRHRVDGGGGGSRYGDQ